MGTKEPAGGRKGLRGTVSRGTRMPEEVTLVCKKWVMFDGTDGSASIASVSITSKGRTVHVRVHLLSMLFSSEPEFSKIFK
jgi:hypothetical protein